MEFERRVSTAEKWGARLGWLAGYVLFTVVLYFILAFFKGMGFFNVILLSLGLLVVGLVVRRIL